MQETHLRPQYKFGFIVGNHLWGDVPWNLELTLALKDCELALADRLATEARLALGA